MSSNPFNASYASTSLLLISNMSNRRSSAVSSFSKAASWLKADIRDEGGCLDEKACTHRCLGPRVQLHIRDARCALRRRRRHCLVGDCLLQLNDGSSATSWIS